MAIQKAKFPKLVAVVLTIMVFPFTIYGISLKDALTNAVQDFRNSNKIETGYKIVISGITNYFTSQKDQLALRIETELYFAFEQQFPEVKLVDVSESVTGISGKSTIFVKGNYRKKGESATLYLKAFKGMMDGEVLYQTMVVFDTEFRQKTLVAVLDIEAKSLNHEQRKILSDIFREALGETGEFEMASSAEIDKMDPDQIQKSTGCTRDTCATIIGEQLGVDRVISTSLRKLDKDYYYFSGKVMDIKDGSIITSKTVKHTGGIRTFDVPLKKLAKKLTEKKTEISIPAPQPTTPVVIPTPAVAKPQASSSNLVVRDNYTGLIWQKDEGGEMEWKKAVYYCQNLQLNGRRDWRLPTKSELATTFPLNEHFPNLVDSYYWSSTTNKDYDYYAWGLTATTGYMFNDGNKTSYYYVRCVRGQQSLSSLIFKDKNTGLEWQRTEPGEFKWSDGIEYCKKLDIAGYKNWRLPTKEELESTFLIKDSFPNLIDGYYWSSTTSEKFSMWAWGMTASTGYMFNNGIKIRSYNIRCVRGNKNQ